MNGPHTPPATGLRSLPITRCGFRRDDGQGHVQELTDPVRRNQSCPCGSGRKFKRCCLVGTRYVAAPEPMVV